jgi:hypothetical protein
MNAMAHYLMSVLTDSADLASDEEMAAINAFNADELEAGGHWVYANGLAAPDMATVVDGRAGETVFTDGPYAESKEFVIGLWIIEAADGDEALRLATGASKACNRRVELRPFANL